MAECSLCRTRRTEFCCAQCASDQLQPRRTMLKALHADVAVLRAKSEAALSVRSRKFSHFFFSLFMLMMQFFYFFGRRSCSC